MYKLIFKFSAVVGSIAPIFAAAVGNSLKSSPPLVFNQRRIALPLAQVVEYLEHTATKGKSKISVINATRCKIISNAFAVINSRPLAFAKNTTYFQLLFKFRYNTPFAKDKRWRRLK